MRQCDGYLCACWGAVFPALLSRVLHSRIPVTADNQGGVSEKYRRSDVKKAGIRLLSRADFSVES